MLNLTAEQIDTQADAIVAAGDQGFGEVQSTIYTMLGGGMLAHSAITQPGHFYIDSRVGRLGYPKRAILQAVSILERAAAKRGVVGANRAIPDYRAFRLNLGVF